MRKRSRKSFNRQEEGTAEPSPLGKVRADFVMERFGNIEEADRSFDIEYWQRQGDAAIFRPPGSWSSSITANKAWSRMNSDFKDLLRIFNEHKVRYLVVAAMR